MAALGKMRMRLMFDCYHPQIMQVKLTCKLQFCLVSFDR